MSADQSPNGLQLTQKPLVARMGRWPLYVGLFALLILLAALIYSVNFAHNEEEEAETRQATVSEEEKPVWLVEGSGLALDPRKGKTSGVLAPPPPKQEPIVIVQKNEKEQEKIDQEAENIRRVRTQAYLSALSAPLAVKRENKSVSGAAAGSASGNGSAGSNDAVSSANMAGSENFYDPAADRDKEKFFDRARPDTSWELREQRTAGMPLELKTGAVVK